MKRVLVGAAYGLILLFFGIIIGGAGHGLDTALVISESPLPPAANFPMSISVAFVSAYVILGVLVIWSGISLLTESAYRWSFPAAMVIHYVAAASYVAHTWGDELSDSYRDTHRIVHDLAPYIAAFAIPYLAGQIWLWNTFAKSSRPATPSIP
jgi:hypothetical protein